MSVQSIAFGEIIYIDILERYSVDLESLCWAYSPLNVSSMEKSIE